MDIHSILSEMSYEELFKLNRMVEREMTYRTESFVWVAIIVVIVVLVVLVSRIFQ